MGAILSARRIRRVKKLRKKHSQAHLQSISMSSGGSSELESFQYRSTTGVSEELNARIERATHELIVARWGSYFSAPITTKLQKGARVLELGCGLGLWSLEVAKIFPASTFIGLDIIENFPTEDLPHNLKFMQCNVLEGLPFEPSSFDYIRVGNVLIGFLDKERSLLLREIVRMLKMGGIFETHDIDATIYNTGKSTERLQNYIHLIFEGSRLLHNILEHIPNIVSSAKQLVDIQFYEQVAPIGLWSDPRGEIGLRMVTMGYELFKPRILQEFDISETEYDVHVQELLKELDEQQSYYLMGRCYATKGY